MTNNLRTIAVIVLTLLAVLFFSARSTLIQTFGIDADVATDSIVLGSKGLLLALYFIAVSSFTLSKGIPAIPFILALGSKPILQNLYGQDIDAMPTVLSIMCILSLVLSYYLKHKFDREY
ncbi:hypothetical protein HUO09_17400 [Vibrio sp. Y2-5]|uniref:hypothetical protein n=1 Tax=Vibrio sp. Y2-5 TaxID=2743977 RepID=UPI0016615F03|nr:hypothetical protein [Vibrio sp. Y2-5]MBD0788133.1 hypothetical protein [Vibrio sp. Y2-5]